MDSDRIEGGVKEGAGKVKEEWGDATDNPSTDRDGKPSAISRAGWSDDGTQSVVRVDPAQVQQWVAGLLQDQAEGKIQQGWGEAKDAVRDAADDADDDD